MEPRTTPPRFPTALEARLLDFDEHWVARPLSHLRELVPANADREFILELLRIDIAKRAALGETVNVDAYLSVFPEIKEFPGAIDSLQRLTVAGAGATSGMPPDGGKQQATAAYPGQMTPDTVLGGRYRLEAKLGEGGMGEVWVAQQEAPVKRKVALKVIKAGMDSQAVLTRFEQERQALAVMDHPNIAMVLDGGMTSERRPFFVMELVKGPPLTRYCDDNKLSVRERLELFVPICQAVQHAHHKGIVHRDLKPSNILVTTVDGRPVPKIIDFGVAKAVSGRLTEETLSTQFGAVIGTLEYMAPEQAGYAQGDVDTRADIYSLGVILYELLTGLRPFDDRRLKRAALDEVLRILREEEPSKPSTRLSSVDFTPSLAAVRRTEPRQLTAALRGELDWVVMKCLEKQRDRRYETANGLARDVQRFLADEPVEAKPPSRIYWMRKFVRRHRGPILAAGLVLGALLAGLAGTAYGLVRAEERRVEATEARAAEARRADGEQQANAAAQRRLRQVQNGFDTLLAVFRALDPKNEEQEGKTLRELLGERLIAAADRLEGDTVGEPDLVAELQAKVGESLRELGLPKPAEPILVKALHTQQRLLGPDHTKTLDSEEQLTHAIQAQARYPEAEKRYQALLARREKLHGPEHQETLTAVNNLATTYLLTSQYKEAEPLFRRAVEVGKRVLGPEHRDVLTGMNNLGTILYSQKRYAEAEPLWRETLALRRKTLGETHTETLSSLNHLAILYTAQNNFAAAEAHARQTIAGYRAKLGEEHPHTLTAVHNLALLYGKMGKFNDAEPLYQQVIDGMRRRHGEDHPDVLRPMQDLAAQYWRQKKLDKSVPLFEKVVARSRDKLGVTHEDTLLAMANLGVNYRDVGRMEEALKLLEEVDRRRVGKPTLAWVADSLVATYRRAGRQKEAIQYLIQAAATARQTQPADSPALATALSKSGMGLLEMQDFPAAEPLLRDCLAIREKHSPRQYPAWALAILRNKHGQALSGLGRSEEAEATLLRAHAELTRELNTVPPASRKDAQVEIINGLIDHYTRTKNSQALQKWNDEKSKVK